MKNKSRNATLSRPKEQKRRNHMSTIFLLAVEVIWDDHPTNRTDYFAISWLGLEVDVNGYGDSATQAASNFAGKVEA